MATTYIADIKQYLNATGMNEPITPQPLRLLLRPQEAADALGISLRTLMTMVERDEIPYVRIGVRNLRFSVDGLRTWIAARSTRQTAERPGE